MSNLADTHCQACSSDTQALDAHAAADKLADLSDHWQLVDTRAIRAEFEFKNYYHTQAFVNAVAYIAHRERHHPDITFGYNSCVVSWSTHAIGGLSDNDFICAAKVDRLRE